MYIFSVLNSGWVSFSFTLCESMDAAGWHAGSRALAFHECQMVGYRRKDRDKHLKIHAQERNKEASPTHMLGLNLKER